MGLESTTFISGLDTSNPLATDPKSQGDDHLRLIKSAVKATFPNLTGAVTPTHTQLNFVAGVTSAIQTQLDGKANAGGGLVGNTVTAPGTGPTNGAIGITAGNGTVSTNGGAIGLTAGTGGGGSFGGAVNINGGYSFNVLAGNVNITGGSSPGAGGQGGDVNIAAGPGQTPANNGKINFINSDVANGAVATTFTGVGPTGAATTVQGWLAIKVAGTARFIPYW